MRRRGLFVLVCLAACAEAPPIPGDELAIVMTTEAQSVAFGVPFQLTVDRVYDASLRPEEWSDETLAPLVVRELSNERYEDGGRILERRVFDARSFEMGDVRVLPPLFVATDAALGAELETSGDALDLFVTPILDPENPGVVELPPGPPDAEIAWLTLLGGLGALAVVGAGLVAAARRRTVTVEAVDEPTVRSIGPDAAALDGLRRMRGEIPTAAEDMPRFFDGVSETLRSYVSVRFPWADAQSTSQELVAAAGADAPGLRALLDQCDLVRYARHDPGPDGVARVLDDAERFVRETSA